MTYYVTMTDSFMSDWKGTDVEGKTNKYIVVCDTYEEAKIVEHNAKHRSEMKYVKISSRNRFKDDDYTKVSFNDDKTSGFFQPHRFCGCEEKQSESQK